VNHEDLIRQDLGAGPLGAPGGNPRGTPRDLSRRIRWCDGTASVPKLRKLSRISILVDVYAYFRPESYCGKVARKRFTIRGLLNSCICLRSTQACLDDNRPLTTSGFIGPQGGEIERL
jgi:hypothetical protein